MTEENKLYEVSVYGTRIGKIERDLLENQFTYGRNIDEAQSNFKTRQEELERLWKKSNPHFNITFTFNEVKVRGARIAVEPLEKMASS